MATPEPSVAELEAQLEQRKAAAEQETSAHADESATPVKDALAAVPSTGGPTHFIDKLSRVTDQFTEAGHLTSADVIPVGKTDELLAVLIKLVGEMQGGSSSPPAKAAEPIL